MRRLTRDGTAEPVSRDQLSDTHGDRGIFIFPVQLTTSRIDNLTRLIHTLLYVMTIHTYIHTSQSMIERVLLYRYFFFVCWAIGEWRFRVIPTPISQCLAPYVLNWFLTSKLFDQYGIIMVSCLPGKNQVGRSTCVRNKLLF